MEELKCEIENNIMTFTVNDKIVENAENTMNGVDELLKLIDDNEWYATNIIQSDDGKKCQNVLQLNNSEVSTDQSNVYIEGSIHFLKGHIFYIFKSKT
jgi:hypothetical protein